MIRDLVVKSGFWSCASIFLAAVLSSSAFAQSLEIYFIDVEGGQATLLVTPGGQALLIDAGFPGNGAFGSPPGDASDARDAQRIIAAATDAGISKIDRLLITHFHGDHFGGAAELSQLITIDTFIDNNTAAPEALNTPAKLDFFEAYRKVRAQATHLVPAVGDRLPLGDIEATVVSTAGSTLMAPLAGAGAANPACDRQVLLASETYENPRSLGVLITFGQFRFLDLGDLAGQPLSDLACPADLIGPVDVYLVPHHGAADSADIATLTAFRPRVAVLNNGATKGGEAPIFTALRIAEGLEDTWQLHRSENEGAENFPDEHIANLDEKTAHWIKLTANSDGSFRMLNGRTGEWKDYAAKL